MQANNLISAVTLSVIALASTMSFAQDAAKLAVIQDGNKNSTATPAKQSTMPLSTAKTIRELLETDDALALSKEKKLLAEDQKRTEKEVGIRADSPEVTAQALRSANESKLTSQREARLLASTIRIDSVMGIQGERVINANVAGRQVTLRETGSNPVAGWRMVQITGACAAFERVPTGPSKKQKASTHASKLTSAEIISQTVCFKRPEPVMVSPVLSGFGPSSQVPLPLPMPAAYNTPPRVVPFTSSPTTLSNTQ